MGMVYSRLNLIYIRSELVTQTLHFPELKEDRTAT